MPTVSVIIPAYNRADLIVETLESVFAQSYRDYEIIVIDDGSTDDTRTVLAPLAAAGELRYTYQENAGLPAARNTGIRIAEGQYVAFLDSDDLFTPDKLEKQMAVFATHPDAMLVHAGFSKFDNAGNDLGYRDTSFYSGQIYPQMLLEWSVLMAAPCVVSRREVFAEVGYFDESLWWAEDLDMWRRIARRYPFYIVPEPLAKIRTHPTSMSSDKTKAADAFLIYLNKAFAEDLDLSEDFKRHALARMYTNVAQNLLGAGRRPEMRLVRAHAWKAMRYWPRETGAYAAWVASFLPPGVRESLIKVWRKLRYRPSQA
ncbi:MAG: glycosyltransferase family 2 protein [Anaerolineales bacterium]|nr:glycosyltransferase family 2 protein [Anaerolineales bacterium]